MKTLFTILALGALLSSPCLAEIHWILHPSVHGIDGPSSPYATSMLGATEIRYVPPVHWAVSGARFLPPGKPQADAFVDLAPINAPAPWTPDRAKALHATILSQAVPKGATKAMIVSEGTLGIQIDGQAAYEICLSYAYYGEEYMESVVYVEHGKTQLRFQFGSLKTDFDSLHSAFVGSLSTLQGF